MELSTKETVEQTLLSFYEDEVTYSNKTPFMQDSILSFIGPLGLDDDVDRILKGDARIPEDVSQAMSEVLKYMVLIKGTSIQYQPKPITLEEAKLGWKGCKERTSSAGRIGSNAHFGHWKVG